MGAATLCEHEKVRTRCATCRRGVARAPRTAKSTPPPAPLPRGTAFQRDRADAKAEAFYGALDAFIEREKAVGYARYKDNLASPLEDRIQAARAIQDVEVVTVAHGTGQEWAQLRCVENRSKFRVGSSLLLHKGDPTVGVPCRLLTDGEKEFRVGPEFRQRLRGVEPGPGWFLDEGWSDYSQNLTRAVEALRKSPRRYWIYDILAGARKPAYDAERLTQAHELILDAGLDIDQAEAFCRAWAARSHHLIQGPPGSGKTAVLSRLAAQLARAGQKVLVTAVTHRAINHALRKTRLHKLGVDVVKVGSGERGDDADTLFATFPDFRQQHPEGDGVVVGATCHTQLPQTYFDTVIFDEASQFPLPLAVRGMLAGKRYIFIGDDQQMDPVVVADHPDAWVAASVFRHLKSFDAGTMLRTTYRLNAELNAFPSKAFYAGQLASSPHVAARRIRYARRPRHWSILDPDVPSVIVEVEHAGATVRNPAEARIAAGLALDAIAAGVPPSEVGIITPFRAQERLIQTEIARRARRGVPRGLVVETVERVQGQERDLTIVSLTVSDVGFASEAADFFFRPSRFNVALTRARSKRVVLMNPALLGYRPGRQHADAVKHLRDFHTMTPKRTLEG